MTHRPRLDLPQDPALRTAYDNAVSNLIDINTVPARTDADPERFIRAGAGYSEPWTRDAALNCWGAGSILEPQVARDTLLMVCDRQEDGRRIIAQDDQWWDQIIWVIAAWQHYLATGDERFLAEAFQIGTDSLRILDRDRYRPRFGLYAGGALMQDGISGYPQPPNEPGRHSSFVLDYPATHELMCLSTNALYVQAHRSLGAMAAALGQDAARLFAAADRIAQAINDRLWSEESGLYGYFLDGDGRLDPHQEAAGLALVVAFGIADEQRRDAVLRTTHREPYGVVNVWPHFPERYSAERPGRHNVMCWPMVMGLFGDAAARAGRADVVTETLQQFLALTANSGGRFFEVYHPVSGAADGGRQTGRSWPSEPDQTWSATAFLRLIHSGVIGVRHRPDGLVLAPTVPVGLAPVSLRGFPYRDAVLDITVTGNGPVLGISLDGRDVPAEARIHVPAGLTGSHEVIVRCGA